MTDPALTGARRKVMGCCPERHYTVVQGGDGRISCDFRFESVLSREQSEALQLQKPLSNKFSFRNPGLHSLPRESASRYEQSLRLGPCRVLVVIRCP